jgi:hypothetical protein
MPIKRGVLTMVGDVTGAQAMLFRQGMGARSGAGRKRKRRTARSARSATTRTRRRGSVRTRRAKSGTRRKKRARLVKGSAAAKRYMAKIRRKRRR